MQKLLFLFSAVMLYVLQCSVSFAQHFTMEAVTGYPFPTEPTSAAQGSKIAWACNEQGKRNVYVAEGPSFLPRKITHYDHDDGQEITSVSISNDGNQVIYVRGGDHGARDGTIPVNAASYTTSAKVQVWTVPFAGGEAKVLSEGDDPVISPKNDTVAFIRGGQVWVAPLDATGAARQLFSEKGSSSGIQWSPDGTQLAFVSNRRDHAFIGIYTNAATRVNWIAPSFSRDGSPRWSLDGKQIAFIRTPGYGGAPDSILAAKHQPWSVWKADITTGKAAVVWKAPATPSGSIPTTDGSTNLHWPAANRIIFLSYHDGWPHLYAIPPEGGTPFLLTPGAYMVEHIKISHDKKWLVFSANTGTSPQDIDRRHIGRIAVDGVATEILTSGNGIETYPVLTGDNNTIAMLAATAQQPLMPAVMRFGKGTPQVIGKELIPPDFPAQQLVTPKQVIFNAPDGTPVHAQLFEPKGGAAKKPAIVYIHGGPQRQMLLGWHYMDYYANDYALNQYLVNQGFTVLSVNYRLGTGYGYTFHKPLHAGAYGASEYQDIKAAGEWLAARPDIDAKRIGIYGGSYGGFLTALGLGRDSKIFAAGVDIHGVHNRMLSSLSSHEDAEKAPDADTAATVAWRSSPVAYVDTWTSPVLLIHADDDRNVPFSQSVDLAKRFEEKGFEFEYLAIPDDTHHWMKYSNAVQVNKATAEFLKRKLGK